MKAFDKAIGFGFALVMCLVVAQAVTACSHAPKQRMEDCEKVGTEDGKTVWDCSAYALPKGTRDHR